jgi:micrococcal nuclease
MPKTLHLLLSLCLLFPGAGFAQFTGVVVDVADGDTLMVMIDRQLLKLDLSDINAPAPGQPYATRARLSLEELCEDKTALIDDLGIGRGKHVFAHVMCDGVDAASEQVRRGMAWVTAQPGAATASLASIEASAKAERRGLWNDAAPVPPWKWPRDAGTTLQ